jgi:hypothetical protein
MHPWLYRYGVPSISQGLLALLLGTPLQARPITSISSAGVVPGSASVEVTANGISHEAVRAKDGQTITVTSPEAVTITASGPGQLILSRLRVEAPSGIDATKVGAEITLTRNGNRLMAAGPLIAASSRLAASTAIGIGKVQARISVRFYSITGQSLPVGHYRASALISVVTD